MSFIQQILSSLLHSGRTSDLKMDQDSLLMGVASEETGHRRVFPWLPIQFPWHKALRLIMVIAAAVVATTFVLHYSIVYIKEVLLYQNSISANANGALLPKKSLSREYGIYLFNTSELWANTGIAISKGDKIRLSVSGAFHSSVGDLYIDTKENTSAPQIRWIGQKLRAEYASPLKRNQEHVPQAEKNSVCVKKDGDAYLGAVLYAIVPEYEPRDPYYSKYSKVWNPKMAKEGLTVKDNSGVLHLTVNDIYFRDTTSIRYYADSIDSMRFGQKFNVDSLLRVDWIPNRKDFSKIFYNDNMGQILVCVEIQHQIKGWLPFWLNPRTAYRWLEDHMDRFFANNSLWLWSLVESIICFFIFTIWIAAICSFWMIITLLGIYLLFLVGYGLSLPWRHHLT